MRKINDFSEISPLVFSHMKPGVITNHIMSADEYHGEIASGTLYAYEWDGGLLFLRERTAHHHMTFYINDMQKLPGCSLPPDTFTEIVAKPTMDTQDVISYWQKAGLKADHKRIRLARPLGHAGKRMVWHRQKIQISRHVLTC